MATWLRVSTQVDVMIGPFLDSVDGNTIEGALTITQPDIRLSKSGTAFAQKSGAQTLTHGENGWYIATLSTTDTNTLGSLIVAVHESGALPVWREFIVVPANVYDSFFSTDFLQVDLMQALGVAITTTVSGVPDVNVKNWRGGTPDSLNVGRVNSIVDAVAANAITDAAVADDMNTYTARVWLARDGSDTDKYAVAWYKNGQLVTSGITLPKINVFKSSDGTDLIAETAMTEIGSKQRFKYEEATNKLTAGDTYFADVKATIDGSVRTDTQPVMRDSA